MTLKAQGEASPEVSAVNIGYVGKNIAPRVRAVETAPLNYKQAPSGAGLERNVNAAGSPTSLLLPAVGQRRTSLPSTSALENNAAATLQYSKGFITARWNALDANEDPLLFKLEMKPKNSGMWQLLKDKVTDRYYAFDSTAFPDGEYTVRVTASDAPGNIPSEALASTLESEPFRIDNTPPEIMSVKQSEAGSECRVSFTARDALSWISKAEYSVDGADWVLLNPTDRVTDSQQLSYAFTTARGHFISLRVFDENDNVAVKQVAAQ